METATLSNPTPLTTRWNIKGFQDAMQSTERGPQWAIEGLVAKKSATLVSGQPHAGKSLAWLDALLEAITQHKVWGHFDASNVNAVLFVETEDPAFVVEGRIRGFARGLKLATDDLIPGFHYLRIGPFELVKEEAKILELAKEYNLDLIVISTLQNLVHGADLSSQKDMAPIMALVVRLAEYCPTVLLTHSPRDKRLKRATGTVTQDANFLTTIHFEKFRNKKAGQECIHASVDSKLGCIEPDFTLSIVADGKPGDAEGVSRVEYSCNGRPKGFAKDAILEAHEEDPGATPKEIAALVGATPRHVQNVLKEAKKQEASFV
jgi:hypothetical protein